MTGGTKGVEKLVELLVFSVMEEELMSSVEGVGVAVSFPGVEILECDEGD